MATASVRAEIAPDSGNNSYCFLSGIKPLVPLNLQTNRVENWSLWKQDWSNYVVIYHLNSQSVDYHTAMLLNSISTNALKIYNGFAFDNGDTRDIATTNVIHVNIRKAGNRCSVRYVPTSNRYTPLGEEL